MVISVATVKIPTALVIMGSLMCMVATTVWTNVDLRGNLFQLGVVAVGIGVGSWIIIQIYNYTRIIAARRRRRELRVKARQVAAQPQRQVAAPSRGPPQQFRRFR